MSVYRLILEKLDLQEFNNFKDGYDNCDLVKEVGYSDHVT